MNKIKQALSDMSITRKVLITFVTITISIVLSGFIATLFGANYLIRNTTIDYTYQLVGEVENSVYDYQLNMMHMAEAIKETTEVQNFVGYFDGDISEDETLTTQVAEALHFVKGTRSDITNIFVMSVGDSGELDIISDLGSEVINPYANYKESLWYIELIENKEDRILTSSYVQNLVSDQYNWVISYGHTIKDDQDQIIGLVLIDLNYSSIERILDNVMPKEQGYIYLLSDNQEIVYHPRQQLIFNKVKTEDTSIVKDMYNNYKQVGDQVYVTLNSGLSNWKTVAVLDSTVVYRNTLINTIIFLIVAIIFIVISFYISYVFSNRFTTPIKDMAKQMKKVEQGDLSARVDVMSSDEIGHLGESFNMMTGQLDSLVKRIVIEQEEKRQYELNALRSQINPHFLYNTLDSIIWMAECDQNAEVIEMTSALSKMLRASINNRKGGVTLGLEIQHVVNYLKIQKFRYSNKLEYEIDIPQYLYNNKAAHLVLQPLVENAIYHGIKGKDGGGKITIRAYERMEDEKLLFIQVMDDGVGMCDDEIKQILDKEGKNPYGLGVMNVNKRIALIYGDDYGLSIESKVNQGTTVTIRIPSIEMVDNGGDLYVNKH